MPPGEIPAINARTLSLNMITFYWGCGDFTKVFQKFYKGSGKRFYMRKIRSTASMVTNYSEKSNINFAIIKGKLCCILLFFLLQKMMASLITVLLQASLLLRVIYGYSQITKGAGCVLEKYEGGDGTVNISKSNFVFVLFPH